MSLLICVKVSFFLSFEDITRKFQGKKCKVGATFGSGNRHTLSAISPFLFPSN